MVLQVTCKRLGVKIKPKAVERLVDMENPNLGGHKLGEWEKWENEKSKGESRRVLHEDTFGWEDRAGQDWSYLAVNHAGGGNRKKRRGKQEMPWLCQEIECSHSPWIGKLVCGRRSQDLGHAARDLQCLAHSVLWHAVIVPMAKSPHSLDPSLHLGTEIVQGYWEVWGQSGKLLSLRQKDIEQHFSYLNIFASFRIWNPGWWCLGNVARFHLPCRLNCRDSRVSGVGKSVPEGSCCESRWQTV